MIYAINMPVINNTCTNIIDANAYDPMPNTSPAIVPNNINNTIPNTMTNTLKFLFLYKSII